MNKYLEFENSDGIRYCKSKSDEYILLSYFIGDYIYDFAINEVISDIELVVSGEMTFDEMTDNTVWGIGHYCGEFICDQEKAYFIPDKDSNDASIEMPVQELITLLKEWRDFMKTK